MSAFSGVLWLTADSSYQVGERAVKHVPFGPMDEQTSEMCLGSLMFAK